MHDKQNLFVLKRKFNYFINLILSQVYSYVRSNVFLYIIKNRTRCVYLFNNPKRDVMYFVQLIEKNVDQPTKAIKRFKSHCHFFRKLYEI